MNTTLGSFEKAFYSDGYRLGMQAVESGLEKHNLFEAIAEMHRGIDTLIEQLMDFAKTQGQKVDCRLGCEWCCHQPVFALDYELDYLKSYLLEYFDDETLVEISTKAQQKQNKLGSLKNDDLLNAKHPCPLLNEGACMAYEARPMACRIYLSSDLATCIKFHQNPEDKSNYPALLDFPMRAGRMMNEGFKAALKARGIVAKEFRIEEKLT